MTGEVERERLLETDDHAEVIVSACTREFERRVDTVDLCLVMFVVV
jgi:hypothetical protein